MTDTETETTEPLPPFYQALVDAFAEVNQRLAVIEGKTEEANAEAALIQAKAAAELANLKADAALLEAKLQSIYSVDQAMAATEFKVVVQFHQGERN